MTRRTSVWWGGSLSSRERAPAIGSASSRIRWAAGGGVPTAALVPSLLNSAASDSANRTSAYRDTTQAPSASLWNTGSSARIFAHTPCRSSACSGLNGW